MDQSFFPKNADRVRFHLNGRSVSLDPRTHAVRKDLADVKLAGVLFSAHYASAVPMTCSAPAATVFSSPSLSAEASSQILRGEAFMALDVTTEWLWGYCAHDHYVGYVRRDAFHGVETPAFRVCSVSAPVFSQPDIKSSVVDHWPGGAQIEGEAQGDFVACHDGFVHMRHVEAADMVHGDWTEQALRFLGTPYLWGGRGHGGIDCSGLVQRALAACGITAPRDTDLQRAELGAEIAEGEALQRGDIIYFPGHVGIMTSDSDMVHANAFWMSTVVEPLADVVARLAPDHEQPVLARRRIAK